jgi:hypothetical protein
MGRFSFRAGANAENPDFVIIQPDRRDTIRRLTVADDGTVTETFTRLGGEDEGDQ